MLKIYIVNTDEVLGVLNRTLNNERKYPPLKTEDLICIALNQINKDIDIAKAKGMVIDIYGNIVDDVVNSLLNTITESDSESFEMLVMKYSDIAYQLYSYLVDLMSGNLEKRTLLLKRCIFEKAFLVVQ